MRRGALEASENAAGAGKVYAAGNGHDCRAEEP